MAPLDHYECRHGMGYTRISGEKDKLSADILSFVPLNFTGEVQLVTLRIMVTNLKNSVFFHLLNGAYGMRLMI
jgi:cellobiose phosphorylase